MGLEMVDSGRGSGNGGCRFRNPKWGVAIENLECTWEEPVGNQECRLQEGQWQLGVQMLDCKMGVAIWNANGGFQSLESTM
jgi:hypothetical protein